MEKEKNMMMMVNYYLKENIYKGKDGMEKEKNMVKMDFYLKEHI